MIQNLILDLGLYTMVFALPITALIYTLMSIYDFVKSKLTK